MCDRTPGSGIPGSDFDASIRRLKGLPWGGTSGIVTCEAAECFGKKIFSFVISVKGPVVEERKNEAHRNAGEEDREERPSGYRVLVVDDEKEIGQLVTAFLSRQGHQCITAGSGVEALNKISQIKCDAVITDIRMREMDGIVLTKELLSLYPGLPVMVMTGYSEDYPAELVSEAGAREFIRKPFSHDEFVLRFSKMMADHEIFRKTEEERN